MMAIMLKELLIQNSFRTQECLKMINLLYEKDKLTQKVLKIKTKCREIGSKMQVKKNGANVAENTTLNSES